MKIIYLDQFIVSDLADFSSDKHSEIRKLLENLVKAKKVICPLSMEHYLETASRSNIDARKNDELMNSLSGGKCFYQEFYISTFLIIALLRNQPFKNDMFIDDAVKNIFNNESAIQNYRNANQHYKESRIDLLDSSNELRKITRSSKISKSDEDSFFKILRRIPADKFTKRIEYIIDEGQFEIRGEKTSNGEIPNSTDLILEYLFRHFNITPHELAKLYKELKDNGFENIPTLDILSSLSAIQSVKKKKLTANDEIDNLRIACGLPISDILITDKKRKAEIIELGFETKYDCKILSGITEDLTKFEEYLNKLKTTGNKVQNG